MMSQPQDRYISDSARVEKDFLRLKGRGFVAKDGKRGDQLVAVEIDVPADDPELQKFAEGWTAPANPRAGLGV